MAEPCYVNWCSSTAVRNGACAIHGKRPALDSGESREAYMRRQRAEELSAKWARAKRQAERERRAQ